MALILGISTVGVLTSVTTSLLANSLIRAINDTSQIIKKITNFDKPTYEQVNKLLIELDMDFTLKIITSTISEIDDFISNDKCSDSKKPSSIKIAIFHITETINNLNQELSKIYEGIRYHNSKYFKDWRTFSCDCDVDKIKIYKNILDSRYKILIDLIKISKI